jgi:hypothetical protein
MAGRDEYQAEPIQADAYIDALISRRAAPRRLADEALDAPLQRAIDVLAGLPRFHPSFAFEESLAARLRDAADGPAGSLAEIIRLPAPRNAASSVAEVETDGMPTFAGIDRRLIVGGAIASGVSIAGIAGAIAWRQRAR